MEIGSVAAVLQVTELLVKTTKELRRCLKSIRKAPEEVWFFSLETNNFTGLLDHFANVTEGYLETLEPERQKETDALVWNIKCQCSHVWNGLKTLTTRFKDLASGNVDHIQKIWQSIKYMFDKPDVEKLRLELQRALMLVNCLTTTFMAEDMVKKKIFNRRTQIYRAQLRNWKPMAQELTEKLVKHKQKHEDLYDAEIAEEMTEMSRRIYNRAVRVVKTIPPPTIIPIISQESSVDNSPSSEPFEYYSERLKTHTPPKRTRSPTIITPGSVSKASKCPIHGQTAPTAADKRCRSMVYDTSNRGQRCTLPRYHPSGSAMMLDKSDPEHLRIYPTMGPRPSGTVTDDKDGVQEVNLGVVQSHATEIHHSNSSDVELIVSDTEEPLAESPSSIRERNRHPWGPSRPGSTVGAPTVTKSQSSPEVNPITPSAQHNPTDPDRRGGGVQSAPERPRRRPPRASSSGVGNFPPAGRGGESTHPSNIPNSMDEKNATSDSEEDPPSPYVPMPPFDEKDMREFNKRRRPRRPRPKTPG